jgi:hypothetical protein
MRNVLILISGLLLTASVAACRVQVVNPPHELTPEGAQVVLVERRIEVLPCTQLGAIQGRASSVFRSDILKDIQIDARNKAAYQGANRIIQKPSYLLIRNQEMSSAVYDMYLCQDNAPPMQQVTPEPRQSASLDGRS